MTLVPCLSMLVLHGDNLGAVKSGKILMTTRDDLQPAEASTSVSSSSNKGEGESSMNTYRKTAMIVGVLFLLGYVGVFLGSAFYAPILDAPDYLSKIYPDETQVKTGMLIELVNDVAVVGIAVMLFPILRKHSEAIALGYVGFRVIEAVTLVVSKISILSLIPVSQEYIAAGAPAASYFQALGASAVAQRYWASQMQTVFFILGALLLYWVLYRSRLIPRWISVWGLIAVASLTAANVLGVPDPTQGFQPATLLYLAIFLSEILLAIWLIAKGFSPSAIAPARVGPRVTAQA
jgi:hypothetical protein